MKTITFDEARWKLVPIERRLVDFTMLAPHEVAWWNAYHARVLEVIAPSLEGEALAWLKDQCQPVADAAIST